MRTALLHLLLSGMIWIRLVHAQSTTAGLAPLRCDGTLSTPNTTVQTCLLAYIHACMDGELSSHREIVCTRRHVSCAMVDVPAVRAASATV